MNKFVFTLSVLFLVCSCKNEQTNSKINSESKNEVFKKKNGEASANDTESKLEVKESPKLIKTEKEYNLESVKVLLSQEKSEGSGVTCSAKIDIFKNGKKVDSLKFSPEAVGGDYGISNGVKLTDHLVFTKHGDYDGRTLIINNNGKLHNVAGGINYIDKEAQILFANYESDLGGFSIFDLKGDSVIMEIDELGDSEIPTSFHKDFGNRYFMRCEKADTEATSFWEFEMDFERMMQVELEKGDLNKNNELTQLPSLNVDCVCAK